MVVKVTELPAEAPTIAKHFAKMRDPRRSKLRYPKFTDILVIGICAVTCGAYDYARTIDKNHGRIEVRYCWTIAYPSPQRFFMLGNVLG